MQRGEVWWVEFDERRPMVLLSGDESSGLVAMQVVAPAGTDISDLGVEVAVGVREGLPFDGVLRFGFSWPGFTPCTWLTTLGRDDLIERAGVLSAAKLDEIDEACRAAERGMEWTPAAAARLSEIKESLRRSRAQAAGADPGGGASQVAGADPGGGASQVAGADPGGGASQVGGPGQGDGPDQGDGPGGPGGPAPR